MSFISTAAFIVALKYEHYSLTHAQCLVFSMLVLIQLFHAFLSRSFTKSLFTVGVSELSKIYGLNYMLALIPF